MKVSFLLASAGFLLSLHFDLENEGHTSIFPWNVGLSPNQAVLHPRNAHARNHSHEK
jgi:hypothetical protein